MTTSCLDYLTPASATARDFIMPLCESLAHLGFGTPVVGYDPTHKIGQVRNHLRFIQIDTHGWFQWLDDTMRLSFDVHLDGEDDSCLCGLRRAADGSWYAVAPARPDKLRIPIGHTRDITLRVILEAAVKLFENQVMEWIPRGSDIRPALVMAYRKELGLPPVV